MGLDREQIEAVRRGHPIFFWGSVAMLALLVLAAGVVLSRVPRYMHEAAVMDERMDAEERQTRDRILDSRARRSALAIALMRRELTLRSLEESGVHLAISTEDSTLALRHGSATLRRIPVQIGPDSTVRAPDGRSWRLVRALGERRLAEKQVDPTVVIPEWVYVGAGEPVPPESERRVEGALGQYVLRLNDGTEIYSQPETGPFAGAVKPGAFRAAEGDLAAIFEAVSAETPVYIY